MSRIRNESGDSDYDEIEIEIKGVKKETAKAFLIDFGDKQEVWIPKSQIKGDDEDLENNVLVIPRWLAKADGLGEYCAKGTRGSKGHNTDDKNSRGAF